MVDNPNTHDEQNDGHNPFFAEDDFLAAERFDEFEDDPVPPAEKLDFKEIWNKNPSVKIFAIVAGLAVVLIGYMAFGGSSDSSDESVSVIRQTRDVSQPPGTAELPPAYEEAVRKASEQRAEIAAMTQGSSIPTPIARPSERIEAPVQVEEIDPLSAWRREAEANRVVEPRDPVVTLDNITAPNLPDLSSNQNAQHNLQQMNAQPQAPAHPPLPTAPSPEMIQALAQQMQQQMQTVMETQIPRESVVVNMNLLPAYDMRNYFPPEGQPGQPGQQGQMGTQGGNVTQASAQMQPTNVQPQALIPAGTIAYAQVLTQANSDVPGPVLAEIASGPLVGGRAIGQFQIAENHLVLQFNRVVKDGKEYSTQGYALDPGTTLPGVATRIHNHYFSRVFLPAAARFIEGFADAATRQESSAVVTNGTVVTTTGEKLDTKQEIMEGVNRGAKEISRMLEQDANRRKTIIVDAGTRIGILFMTGVMDTQSQQNQLQNNPYANMLPNASGQWTNLTPAGAAYNAYNAYNSYNQQQQYQPYQQAPSGYNVQPPVQQRPIGF